MKEWQLIYDGNLESTTRTIELTKDMNGTPIADLGLTEWICEANHLAYVEEVMVKPQSYGGDTSGVNIPFKVSSDGKRTEGYVSATSLASGNPEFTAGAIPHSLSTGKEVL